MNINRKIIAAFDFDNTITDRDSLLPFLYYVNGKMKTAFNLSLLLPSFVLFLTGYLSRQSIKEEILKTNLNKYSLQELDLLARDYADHILDKYLKKEAIAKLKWHQSQNHTCVLISASLELYLNRWARRHGFERVLASKLEITSNNKINGKLLGLNCWGPEKARRLIESFGPKENYELYTYGDSRGDHELLNLADHPFYRSF